MDAFLTGGKSKSKPPAKRQKATHSYPVVEYVDDKVVNIYIFYEQHNKPIYAGQALDLKRRCRQHARDDSKCKQVRHWIATHSYRPKVKLAPGFELGVAQRHANMVECFFIAEYNLMYNMVSNTEVCNLTAGNNASEVTQEDIEMVRGWMEHGYQWPDSYPQAKLQRFVPPGKDAKQPSTDEADRTAFRIEPVNSAKISAEQQLQVDVECAKNTEAALLEADDMVGGYNTELAVIQEARIELERRIVVLSANVVATAVFFKHNEFTILEHMAQMYLEMPHWEKLGATAVLEELQEVEGRVRAMNPDDSELHSFLTMYKHLQRLHHPDKNLAGVAIAPKELGHAYGLLAENIGSILEARLVAKNAPLIIDIRRVAAWSDDHAGRFPSAGARVRAAKHGAAFATPAEIELEAKLGTIIKDWRSGGKHVPARRQEANVRVLLRHFNASKVFASKIDKSIMPQNLAVLKTALEAGFGSQKEAQEYPEIQAITSEACQTHNWKTNVQRALSLVAAKIFNLGEYHCHIEELVSGLPEPRRSRLLTSHNDAYQTVHLPLTAAKYEKRKERAHTHRQLTGTSSSGMLSAPVPASDDGSEATARPLSPCAVHYERSVIYSSDEGM